MADQRHSLPSSSEISAEFVDSRRCRDGLLNNGGHVETLAGELRARLRGLVGTSKTGASLDSSTLRTLTMKIHANSAQASCKGRSSDE
jgi:hypothetical protein